MHKDCGTKDLVPSGPLYKGHKAEGRTIRVKFDYAQNGLILAKKDGYEQLSPTQDTSILWLSIHAKDW